MCILCWDLKRAVWTIFAVIQVRLVEWSASRPRTNRSILETEWYWQRVPGRLVWSTLGTDLWPRVKPWCSFRYLRGCENSLKTCLSGLAICPALAIMGLRSMPKAKWRLAITLAVIFIRAKIISRRLEHKQPTHPIRYPSKHSETYASFWQNSFHSLAPWIFATRASAGKARRKGVYFVVSLIFTCFRYCDAIDGHFLVTPHPDFENLIVASGDSGHGMK